MKQKVPGTSYEIDVRNAGGVAFTDVYYAFLKTSWTSALAWIVAVYLAINGLFAGAYWWTDGIANPVVPGFLGDFFFSIQTMGTIGYGSMYPVSVPANLLVVAESVVSLLLTALTTGLVFAKFAQRQARIEFSRQGVVARHDGVPTLIFRVGNMRGNRILESTVHLDASMTRITEEGRTFYRILELKPVRGRIAALSRTFNVMHAIDADSPLYGLTPADWVAREVEIGLTVIGLDDTTGQTTFAQRTYEAENILHGRRFADALHMENGVLVLDLAKFHVTEAEPPPSA